MSTRRRSKIRQVDRQHRQVVIDPRLRRLLQTAANLVEAAAPDDERFLPLRRALDPFTGALERPVDVKTTLSDLGRERGITAEQRVLRVVAERMRDERAPRWLIAVRAATSAEDAKGWDLVLATADVGELGVQVKATVHRANAARAHAYREGVTNTVFLGAPALKTDSELWAAFSSTSSFVYSVLRRRQLKIKP